MSESLIFDIKRYAINDGPGIRVVIFFKGCNLSCAWCHNPESISPKAEKMFAPARCIRCGSCVEVCPEKAITLTPEGIVTDPETCKVHGRCADVCPTRAIEMSGRVMTVEEIMNAIEKERVFFDHSGGGVTFSGGEPLLHIPLLTKLLDECGRRGIHRAVDTAGNVSSKVITDVAERIDLFLYDLKMMDPVLHRKWTNTSNDRILSNLILLAERGSEIIIRIPLMGGINDTEENIDQTARFLASLAGDRKQVNLLPFHKIAQNKYMKLGRPDSFELFSEPGSERLAAIAGQFAAYGIKATVGG